MKKQILFPFLDLIFINLFLYFICDSVMRELILLLSFSSSLSVSSDSAIDRGDTSSTELANRLVELEKELMYVARHMTPPKSNWISNLSLSLYIFDMSCQFLTNIYHISMQYEAHFSALLI